jgi:GNAT superfamily N-acetyltransferase
MEICTLDSTALETITATFNEAFSDYFIPLAFTPEAMASKMKSEGVQLSYSIGAFDGEKLVGLILHACDCIDGVKTIYNGGTGVIPSYRGRGLTGEMYRYAVPLLKRAGISHHLLEVIDKNEPARNVYEAVGFQTVRNLAAFKTAKPIGGTSPVAIRTIDAIPADPAFAGMKPTWQNTTAAICRDMAAHHLIGAFVQENLVGYAAWVPAAGRVKQFAVHAGHRRNGIGTALFRHMLQNSSTGSLLVTNIDEDCLPVVTFLEKLNLQRLLRLYEMKMEVR